MRFASCSYNYKPGLNFGVTLTGRNSSGSTPGNSGKGGREEIIHVSEIAAIALLESLQAIGVEPDKGLRLTEEEDKCALNVDSPGKNDRVIWYNKCTVIIINRHTEQKTGDALVDVEEGAEEAHLVLRRNVGDSWG